MTDGQKQQFTRRITQANRSGLLLIKFEILFAYFDDIETAFHQENKEELKNSIRHADEVLKSLQETLDFQYEVSSRLYALYDFHRRQLAKILIRHSLKECRKSRELLEQTYQAFKEAAKQDGSKPLMENAQHVYAGMTYGKHDLNENYDAAPSRGFLA